MNAVLTNTTCLNNDGTAVLSTINGTAPFTYSVDGSNWQTAASFTGLASAQYIFLVKDGNGCQGIRPATIAMTDNLVLTVNTPPVMCEGTAVTLSAQGNATAYSAQ